MATDTQQNHHQSLRIMAKENFVDHIKDNIQSSQTSLVEPNDDIDKRFHILEKIGEGTYGIVYKAIDKKTNQVSILYTIFYFSEHFPKNDCEYIKKSHNLYISLTIKSNKKWCLIDNFFFVGDCTQNGQDREA